MISILLSYPLKKFFTLFISSHLKTKYSNLFKIFVKLDVILFVFVDTLFVFCWISVMFDVNVFLSLVENVPELTEFFVKLDKILLTFVEMLFVFVEMLFLFEEI